jgi:hypothetical protein
MGELSNKTLKLKLSHLIDSYLSVFIEFRCFFVSTTTMVEISKFIQMNRWNMIEDDNTSPIFGI